MVMLVLTLSFAFGGKASAAGSLGEGTYTVGEELSAGLNQFSIQEGTAEIEIRRGSFDPISGFLDSDKI